MRPNMKLVAGPARVSARLLTAEDIQEFGLEELKAPFVYGIVTSIGWDFKHTTQGIIIILDINAAVKVFPDTYIIEERAIIAKFVSLVGSSGFFHGKPLGEISNEGFLNEK